MKCKHCGHDEFLNVGDFIVGDDRQNPTFKEYLCFIIATCASCKATQTFHRNELTNGRSEIADRSK